MITYRVLLSYLNIASKGQTLCLKEQTAKGVLFSSNLPNQIEGG